MTVTTTLVRLRQNIPGDDAFRFLALSQKGNNSLVGYEVDFFWNASLTFSLSYLPERERGKDDKEVFWQLRHSNKEIEAGKLEEGECKKIL